MQLHLGVVLILAFLMLLAEVLQLLKLAIGVLPVTALDLPKASADTALQRLLRVDLFYQVNFHRITPHYEESGRELKE